MSLLHLGEQRKSLVAQRFHHGRYCFAARKIIFFSFFSQVSEIRKIIGPIADKFPSLFSDASIQRFLIARNWNTKKAAKMMKETLKWRLEFKPEKIKWVCIIVSIVF